MVRYKVSAETLKDVLNLIQKMNNSESPIYLTNRNRTKKLGAASLLSELSAFDWSEVWVESEDPKLYSLVREYVV